MSKPSTLMHPSNTALNSACLSPHHSMILPERQPEEDEKLIMQAIEEVSRGNSKTFNEWKGAQISDMFPSLRCIHPRAHHSHHKFSLLK